jgi:hypothetical protein
VKGDKYQVFYSVGGNSVLHETVDDWGRAKELRGNLFDQNRSYRAVWIMRNNPSLNLRPEKFGFTLRRPEHDRR